MYLLPSMDHVLVSYQPLPCQSFDPRTGTLVAHSLGEELPTPRREGLALGGEVVADEAKGPVSEDARADVGKAGVAGTETQGALGEAVFGDMLVGGREDGLFGLAKRARGRRVVVRVEGSSGDA
jgi:hypothetical protein